jgi:hypothetical protein
MTVRELDRLVTRTEMTPISKRALRNVRQAVISGRSGNALIGQYSWSVGVDTEDGQAVRTTFSFKRE